MSYWPGTEPLPALIGPYTGRLSPLASYRFLISLGASGTPPGSTIWYYPVVIPSACPVARVWWINGSTITGGATVYVGIYSDGGYKPATRLVSGSAVQGTASQIQFVSVTATTLPPGRYWIGLAFSTATNTTCFRATSSGAYDAAALFNESGTSLPATATPVEASMPTIFHCGFATTASP